MKALIVAALERVITALYYVYQFIFLTRIKTWLSDHAPYRADSFAPAGFFEPIPSHLPPGSPIPGVNDDLAWKVGPNGFFAFLNPLGLLAIKRNVQIFGTVLLVETRPKNAYWYHDTFYIAPNDTLILNRFAIRCKLHQFDNSGSPVLKCWVPIGTVMPAPGTKVVAEGTLCADLANRWIGLAAGAKRWAVRS